VIAVFYFENTWTILKNSNCGVAIKFLLKINNIEWMFRISS